METKITVDSVSFTYGHRTILKDVNCALKPETITAITGPSGTGKSTFLSLFNRLWEEQREGQISGKILMNLKGEEIDIHSEQISLSTLRRKVGMVFQTPNPLPMSIIGNIAFPLQLIGKQEKKKLRKKAEETLDMVHLLNEVKDRLNSDARLLSGGQQQRLCLARSLMLDPEVLLLDEPTSSLDPEACLAIENLVLKLKKTTTIVLVSHYHDQVQRIADEVYELREKNLHKIFCRKEQTHLSPL